MDEDGTGAQSIAAGAIALGADSAATGVDSIAIGPDSSAAAVGAIAIGHDSVAADDTADTNAVAIGNAAQALHADAVAIGASSVTSADNTVSFGTVGAERRLMNVDDGIEDTDAATVGQVNTIESDLSADITSINTVVSV